jgi:hypothetical protein
MTGPTIKREGEIIWTISFLIAVLFVVLGNSFAFAGEHPLTFLCSFKSGKQFVFSNFNFKEERAVFKDVNMGWEGTVLVFDNGLKLDLLEKNASDNGFIVTIDYFHKNGNEFYSVYSSVSPNPENKFATTMQELRTCK